MRLELHVRRVFCEGPDCPQGIFTERLPGVLAPYARRTDRLAGWFTAVGFALGGEAGVHAGIIITRNARIKVADPSLGAMLVEADVDSTGGPDAQESESA
jgi:hypothetical protein